MDKPTYDQISALPRFAEQPVPVAFEDRNGHLNVRHYLGIASEGLDDSLVEVGIPKDWNDTGRAIFSVEHHLSYFHELITGDKISVRTRLVGRSEKAVHVLVYLVDEGNQRVPYLMEEIFLCIDMTQEVRRAVPWSEETAALLDARIAEHAQLGWEPHLSGTMRLR